MRRVLVAACLVWAGCAKDGVADGPVAGTLTAAAMGQYATYEAFCADVRGGTCLGEWEGHPGGSSALGAWRFVAVEYPNPRDGQGPAREIHLELKTPRGTAYRVLGQTRAGKVSSSLMVKEVVELPGALELQLVFRSAPRMVYSDYYSSVFVLAGANGPVAVEVPLGKIVGDINTGGTRGKVGDVTWKAGKLVVKGATVADGVWTVAAQ